MTPRYGSRLMPVVVDELAKKQPDLVYASVPLTNNIGDGFKGFTFADIASATNHVAAWIDGTFGRSPNFGTIAYMGLGDLRYVVVFLAAVKCGYKVLLPSLRNSPWMNASLLEQTECSHLLYAPEVEGLVKPLLEHRQSLQLHLVEPLQSLIRPDTPHYPYEKTFEEAKWDPILILHSSGSTGAPRPIQMNHGTFAVGDNDRNLPTVPGRVNQNWSLWDFPQKAHFFSPFPAFHLAGFSSMVMLPIYYSNATLVMSPPTRPPTGHLVNEIMDHFELKSIFCPPIIAEQLVQEPGGLEKCKSLNFLLYAGGPLSQAAGDALSKVTDVCQFYGQTETGAIQALVPLREDWASLEWHPKQEAIMEPSVDGSFEMIMHRNPDLAGIRNVSCNFPDVDVWRTKDLFKPHPTKPGLWRFHGRADDIIVLSNGEKFNPVPSETQIAAHPLVAGALIIGNSYPQASLVLELKDYSQDTTAVLEAVWPTIEKANAEAPAHAKITRDMVLIGSKDKPFERSPKGTVIRNSSGKKYEQQVAELHSQDISKNLQHIKLGSSHDSAAVTKFIKDVVSSAFKHHSLSEDDDLFVLGLDSLQTTEIISLLKAGIASGRSQDVSWITARFVYEHPSIHSLSEALHHRLVSTNDTSLPPESDEAREKRIADMVSRNIKGLPSPISTDALKPQESNLHILLTGSTGSLGTQILLKLASDPRVARVTCLDRSANAHERITQSLSTWTQPPALDVARITFLQADYGKPDFGLAGSIISGLRESVNLVIHNAWKVDFNHSLASFEAVHIRGVQNFINFSAASTFHPRIVFISSISSVGDWHPNNDQPKKVVPEAIPPTASAAQKIGYAESKAVAEQILAAASTQSHIPTSIIRIGQIAGPSEKDNGAKWNEHEWFPLLLKTAQTMGKIPDETMLDNVDWIPVDTAASTILELSLPSSPNPPETLQVYHLINPTLQPWTSLLPFISSTISPAFPAAPVPLSEGMLGAKYIGAGDVVFGTEKAREGSRALREVGPVTEEWVGRWMKDWDF
ncbi:putative NRPS-like enzyme [Byssothecium circinans]|uniref:Putative NRPS-like enzyme n=1 Tax=Byssothecium circinans TaxID=147558 RepID=A0A6A5TKL6_9PLEO|nr:putative NRPS-like enzyme [Byssothecium circinans]